MLSQTINFEPGVEMIMQICYNLYISFNDKRNAEELEKLLEEN